jgi:hypothetical protein
VSHLPLKKALTLIKALRKPLIGSDHNLALKMQADNTACLEREN